MCVNQLSLAIALLVALQLIAAAIQPADNRAESMFKFNYTASNRSNATTNKTSSELNELLRTKLSGSARAKTDIGGSEADSRIQKAIRVDSKSGRMMARMQPAKRQVDASGLSRRNEDPWFLDQTPYPLQPYRFVYNIKGKNGQTEQYRQEVGDGKFLSGSYGYVLPDGIYRHVDYVADERGFRAFIRTSEPGTANQNPANVVIASNPVAATSVSSGSYLNQVPETNSQQVNFYNSDGYSALRSQDQELLRRPPGSIVNTPLRNFTSFAFTTPPPPPATTTTTPTTTFNDSPGRGSWASQAQDSGSGDPLALSRIRALQQPQRADPWPPASLLPINYGRLAQLQPAPLPETTRVPTAAATPSAGQSGPSRAGQLNRLAYDRPLTQFNDNANSVNGLGQSNKLSYDMKHVLHPDLPYLSLERARSLAQIDQLNAVGPSLHYIRPLIGGDPVTLTPVGETIGGQVSHSSGTSSGTSSGRAHSSKSEEHHHHHHESSSTATSSNNQQTPEDSGKHLLINREQASGGKSVSGRDFEYHQHESGGGQNKLPPPPAPLFQNRAFDSGVKGARLQAPYAGFGQQKQSQEAQSVGPESEPASPTPPSAPSSPAAPDEESAGQPPSEQPTAVAPPPPQASPAEGGTKGSAGGDAGSTWRGDSAQSGRSVRVPEELRASMGDLRSMQNTLGLPMPPRVSWDERLASGSKLADQMLAARMRRVDALLRLNKVGVASAGQASVPARTVSAASNLLDEQAGKRAHRPAALASGPLSAAPNQLQSDESPEFSLGDAILSGNQTFDARRLSAAAAAANKARLQAEKVSELEKFQQRLRAQQLLLDQIKTQPAAAGFNRTARPRPLEQAVNSHVRYDEDAEQAVQQQQQPFRPAETRDFPRLRRQNEPEVSAGSSSNSNSTRKAARESLSQQIRRWPSLIQSNKTLINPADPANSSGSNSSSAQSSADRANTINLDFINSVTALSVDNLNPFAIATVNPAVNQAARDNKARSAPVGVATANARYFNSPELLAALDYHERRDTSGQLRSLLPSDEGVAAHGERPAAMHWASNHRFGESGAATPTQQTPNLSAAANSQHQSFAQLPARKLKIASKQVEEAREMRSRDGFEIRDRAVQQDNHRFYEVVSNYPTSNSNNEQFASSQAFKG